MDELSLYYDEIRKIILKDDEQGRALLNALTGTTVPANFVELFSPYISSVNQLSSILKFAPESIKKLQLPLYAKVLSQLSQEAYVLQIKTLSNQNILDMLQGALQHSAQDFTYQHLVEMCFFELISRRAFEYSGNYQGFIEQISRDIDYCKQYLKPCASCIMDNLSEYRYQGQSIIDLIKTVNPSLSLDEQVLQRHLLEKLRFSQDRRLEYLNKVKNNLTQDYLWLRNTIRQQTQADTHVADEAYANLKRKPLLEAIKKTTLTEFAGIKIVRDASFPTLTTATQIKQLQGQDIKYIKMALEKPVIKVYDGKISVRLHYVTDDAATKIKQGCFNSSQENQIFEFIIDDTQDLDESVIQDAIRERETIRYTENKKERTGLQKELNDKKRNLMSIESQLENLQVVLQIKELEQQISSNESLIHAQDKDAIASDIEQNQGQLLTLQETLSQQKNLLDQQLPQLAALKKDLDEKKASSEANISKKEAELEQKKVTYKGFDKQLVAQACYNLQSFLDTLRRELGEITQYISKINTSLIQGVEPSEQLPQNPKTFLDEVIKNTSDLNRTQTQIQQRQTQIKELQTKQAQILTDEQVRKLTDETRSLTKELQTLKEKSSEGAQEQTTSLELEAQGLKQKITELNQQLIKKNQELNFRRSMFEALKHNFTAERIGELHLEADDEQKFRRLLELNSVLNKEERPDWLKQFFSNDFWADKQKISDALKKIEEDKITSAFQTVLTYSFPSPNQKNIQDRSHALKKAEESATKQQLLQELLSQLPNPEVATQIKKMLKDAYIPVIFQNT